jgi:hypothetical protein
MGKAVREVGWSTFLRDARAVADEIDQGDVVLRRREGTDLYLSTAERQEATAESVTLLAQLLGELLEDAATRNRLPAVPAFPWLRLLPEADQERFVREFAETASAHADAGDVDALADVVAAWKRAALAARSPGDTVGPDASAWLPGATRNRDLLARAGSVVVAPEQRGADWSTILEATRRARGETSR